ncbi:unknown [Eubacterium sp. CAG:841]|nr:unknown [Eubacterium sp. CAG:841]
MNNCLCNLFDGNNTCLWVIVIACVVLCCCNR